MKPSKGNLTNCSMFIWDTHPIPRKLVLFGQIEPFFGRQCHFTRQNRLLIYHCGMADAISVQRNEGKCPSSPYSHGGGGGGGAALFTSYWQSQADFGESVSKNCFLVASFYDLVGLSARKSHPWANLAQEHSILVRIFRLEHYFFNFFGTPSTSIYYTNYTKKGSRTYYEVIL